MEERRAVWMRRDIRKSTYIFAAIVMALFLQGCSRTTKMLPPTLEVEEGQLQQRSFAYQHFLNGVLLEQSGNLKEAAQEYRSALGFDPESSEIRYCLAEVFYQMNDLQSAIMVARQISPLDARTSILLADSYRQLKQDSLAVEYYQQAVKLDDRDFTSHYNLSGAFRRLGEADSAIYHLRKVLELNPSFRSGYMELAALYVEKQDYARAVETYRTAVTLFPKYLPAYWGLAENYLRCGEKEAALETYRKIDELSPANLVYKRKLLDLYISQGDLDGAIALAEELSILEPSDSFAKMGLGMLYITKGSYQRADSVFSLVLEKEPENLEALLNRGRIKLQLEQMEAAKSDFKKLIALSDSLPDGWRDLALTYVSWDSTAKAIQVLKQGLKKVSDKFPLYYFLAITYHRDRDYSQAIEPLKKALEIHPDDAGANLLLAEVYEYTGDTDRALGILENLVQNDPENTTAANNLGYLLANLGIRLREAKDLIMKALEKEPENPAFLDSYGWVLFKLEDHEEAQRQIARALSNRSDDPIILEHMGDILQAQGRLPEAKEFWKRAVDLDPKNQELKTKLGMD
jgi:tetratricopeptide (TPR) repeat protein